MSLSQMYVLNLPLIVFMYTAVLWHHEPGHVLTAQAGGSVLHTGHHWHTSLVIIRIVRFTETQAHKKLVCFCSMWKICTLEGRHMHLNSM